MRHVSVTAVLFIFFCANQGQADAPLPRPSRVERCVADGKVCIVSVPQMQVTEAYSLGPFSLSNITMGSDLPNLLGHATAKPLLLRKLKTKAPSRLYD